MQTTGIAKLLTHPATLLALAALVANDRWAKQAWGGWATGKISDAAGSFLLACLLACAVAAVRPLLRRGADRQVTVRNAAVSAAIVVVGVAAAKTTPMGADVAAFLLGAFRWPLDAGTSLLASDGIPPVGPVDVIVDATDVLAAFTAFLLVPLVTRLGRKATPVNTPEQEKAGVAVARH